MKLLNRLRIKVFKCITNMARELSSIAEKHLKIEIRDDKKHNKVSQKQYEKFMDLLKAGEVDG